MKNVICDCCKTSMRSDVDADRKIGDVKLRIEDGVRAMKLNIELPQHTDVCDACVKVAIYEWTHGWDGVAKTSGSPGCYATKPTVTSVVSRSEPGLTVTITSDNVTKYQPLGRA
jgi:hypothetical protein